MMVPESAIIRYLQGDATGEEMKILNEWLKEDRKNVEMLVRMTQIWDAKYRMPHRTPAGEHVVRRRGAGLAGRRRNIRIWRYAAAATVAIVATVGILLTGEQLPEKEMPVAMETKTFSGRGTEKIILPDSSTVWLGTNSEIRYPLSFATNNRMVELTGKAYFDVRKTGQAFTVHSQNIRVEVTGTAFEIEAPDEKSITLTLVSGAVNVQTKDSLHVEQRLFSLTPGQQAIIDKNGGEVQIINIDAACYAAWKDGTYRFADEALEKIAEQLSFRFKTKICVAPSMRKHRFTGRVTPGMTFADVMKIIGISHPVSCKTTSEGIYIKEK
ncbi:MAG: FecR family protein [Bacteroidales bacterium]|jgi:ferric-dicitrate binding protein FerR (iron transport regulator)|nr:FecR family protein [Bacteroidales bacterium]